MTNTDSTNYQIEVLNSLSNGTEDKEFPIAMPVFQEEMEYNMNHPSRGFAIIFSNEIFDLELKDRPETKMDEENFTKSLLYLGFSRDNIILCENYTVEQMKDQLKNVATKDHSDNDCVVVAVFSHGGEDKILYATDKVFKENELWEPFFGHNCPTLVGKPKIFVIQACRGSKRDDGISAYDETDYSSSYLYRIPVCADILKCYATFPGYYAWRRDSIGSVFIYALSNITRMYGFKKDFLSILTEVNRQVALYFESISAKDENFNEKKQIPTFESSLTRMLHFSCKNFDVE